jgi:hypothetical protein
MTLLLILAAVFAVLYVASAVNLWYGFHKKFSL